MDRAVVNGSVAKAAQRRRTIVPVLTNVAVPAKCYRRVLVGSCTGPEHPDPTIGIPPPEPHVGAILGGLEPGPCHRRFPVLESAEVSPSISHPVRGDWLFGVELPDDDAIWGTLFFDLFSHKRVHRISCRPCVAAGKCPRFPEIPKRVRKTRRRKGRSDGRPSKCQDVTLCF